MRMFVILFFNLFYLTSFSVQADLIHEAAKKNKIEDVESLLQKEVDVNTKNIYGATPLHYAAGLGHTALTQFLISKGADLNIRSISYGLTPLHLYTFTPLHLYTFTPLHLYTFTPLHLYTFTPCLCKQKNRDSKNFNSIWS